MEILLIRHGMTRYNEERRYQGRSDPPLSPAGRALLQKAEFSPARVYVSPLRRCVETAEILFPGALLIPVEGLRELSFGEFEGKSYVEMEHDPRYRAWVDGGCAAACPGETETREDFTNRVCGALAQLLENEAESPLVIVAHGGTQMAVGSRYGFPKQDYFSWQTAPGEGLRLDASQWESQKVLTMLKKEPER